MTDSLTVAIADFQDPARWQRVEKLLAEAESFDEQPPVSDQAKVAAQLGTRKVLLCSLPANELVAVGIVGEGELDVVVRPGVRGRGIGSRLLNDLLQLAAQEQHTSELKSWVHGNNPAAVSLLTAAGFAPTRTLLKMQLDPSQLPDPDSTPTVPSGFQLSHFDLENLGHTAALIAVNRVAFADHPEQGNLTVEGFMQLTNEPWFDAQDIALCFTDSEVQARLAGFVWNKTTTNVAGQGETELYVIGVHPDFAGRGLGSALLNVSLHRMAQHKPATVSLYVEGDNTPAIFIYERAGFHISQRSQQWSRQ